MKSVWAWSVVQRQYLVSPFFSGNNFMVSDNIFYLFLAQIQHENSLLFWRTIIEVKKCKNHL